MKRTAFALLILLVTTACAASNPATTADTSQASTVPATADPAKATIDAGDGTVVVREGDVVRVPWSAVDVAIVDIADSRCPAVFGGDEVCVWEGEVRTTIEFRSDGGVVEQRVLTGLNAGKGQTVYGDLHWTWFDLVEVSAQELDADGNLALFFSGRD